MNIYSIYGRCQGFWATIRTPVHFVSDRSLVVTTSGALPLDPGSAARLARAQRRSEQLLAAAARLMERDGSEAVSMHALAAEAGVSVGLIYSYFGGKNDLLLAVIVDVLETFATEVPAAVAAAGEDPVQQLIAAFRAYCQVIDQHRHAAVLTYRESKTLTPEGRRKIKHLEIQTSEPLRQIITAGITAEIFQPVDPDLVAYNLLLLAHAWALKHWYFRGNLDLDAYTRKQTKLALGGLIAPQRRKRYAAVLAALDDR
jgi:TetR/AcrR family transcriptional regulator, cholesterol catabolism regulator